MADWQPIETAPRYEVVLVYGEWAGECNGPSIGKSVHIAGWFGGQTDYPGYEWSCADTDAYAAWVKATHWMPLPARPVE